MKKYFIILLLLLFCGCGNITHITNYSDKMYLLKANFPELYTKYINNYIEIDDMYIKNGIVHVNYHHL